MHKVKDDLIKLALFGEIRGKCMLKTSYKLYTKKVVKKIYIQKIQLLLFLVILCSAIKFVM